MGYPVDSLSSISKFDDTVTSIGEIIFRELKELTNRITFSVRSIFGTIFEPIKEIGFYVIPALGALSSHTRIDVKDHTQEAQMPMETKIHINDSITRLAQAAGIKRRVSLWGRSGIQFSSAGGSISASSPAIFVPQEHFFRVNKEGFGTYQPGIRPLDDIWLFTDDQIEFLMARQVARIKYNFNLLQTIAKIAVFIVTFLVCTNPHGVALTIVIVLAILLAYKVSNYSIEKVLDNAAVRILAKARGDETREKAKEIAHQTFHKMQLQNLEKRKVTFMAKLFIKKNGNHRFGIFHPSISGRMRRFSA